MKRFLTALLLAGATVTSATAQDMDSATGEDLGEKLFQTNCSGCHGAYGNGDGIMTDLLTVPVPDLTQLAAKNDGEFPMLWVIQTIDGRSGMRAHGGPMPFFGGMFREELWPLVGSYGAEAIIRGRTYAIAAYVESLQD